MESEVGDRVVGQQSASQLNAIQLEFQVAVRVVRLEHDAISHMLDRDSWFAIHKNPHRCSAVSQ